VLKGGRHEDRLAAGGIIEVTDAFFSFEAIAVAIIDFVAGQPKLVAIEIFYFL
jgi:hypothetical protein